MASEQAADEFMRNIENASPEQLNAITQKALAKGGKFALLARILMGDEEAMKMLDQMIKDGRVGPGWDYSEE